MNIKLILRFYLFCIYLYIIFNIYAHYLFGFYFLYLVFSLTYLFTFIFILLLFMLRLCITIMYACHLLYLLILHMSTYIFYINIYLVTLFWVQEFDICNIADYHLLIAQKHGSFPMVSSHLLWRGDWSQVTCQCGTMPLIEEARAWIPGLHREWQLCPPLTSPGRLRETSGFLLPTNSPWEHKGEGSWDFTIQNVNTCLQGGDRVCSCCAIHNPLQKYLIKSTMGSYKAVTGMWKVQRREHNNIVITVYGARWGTWIICGISL